jgi:hypothetical protein
VRQRFHVLILAETAVLQMDGLRCFEFSFASISGGAGFVRVAVVNVALHLFTLNRIYKLKPFVHARCCTWDQTNKVYELEEMNIKMEVLMRFSTLVIMSAVLAFATFSYADITGNTIADDGDGVVSCYTYGFEKIGEHDFSLDIDGSHNRWEAGHIQGDIITDTELDPSLTLNNVIDNDTGFTWTDYHVKVTMNKTFTLDNVTISNPGWTYVVTAPSPVGSNWIGYINYYAGTPIPSLGAISFSYRMNFLGGASFQEELMPTPEPGTFVLVACGLLGLFVMRRRFA